MPTRSTPAKRPARKTAAARQASRSGKAAAKTRRPRANPADGAAADDRVAARTGGATGKLELAGLAGKLVQGWRKDLEAIVAGQSHVLCGAAGHRSRQTAQIKEAVAELQTVAR